MTSSNLTPKQIIDKNGIATTRNINPDKGSSGFDNRASKVGVPPTTGTQSKPGHLVKMNMSAVSYTVGHWISSSDQYEFNAPYQRGSVWEPERKQNLVRSLLLGIPTGSVIVNIRPYSADDYYGVIIDGKQRIEAVVDFIENRLEVPASWFPAEDLASTEKEMVRYSDLSKGFQTSFKHTTVMPVMEAKVKTVEEEAEIFLLINQGGVEQEDSTMAKARKIAEGN